jgi:hypothetical protein
MRWHGINEAQVRECIMEPSYEEPAIGEKMHSWVKLGEGFLRVTWVEEESTVIVITAVVKRRAPVGWQE